MSRNSEEKADKKLEGKMTINQIKKDINDVLKTINAMDAERYEVKTVAQGKYLEPDSGRFCLSAIEVRSVELEDFLFVEVTDSNVYRNCYLEKFFPISDDSFGYSRRDFLQLFQARSLRPICMETYVAENISSCERKGATDSGKKKEKHESRECSSAPLSSREVFHAMFHDGGDPYDHCG